jgi:glycosyltransferase involved in cell wall biosynthesis
MKKKISICIITYNEEHNMRDCLDSVSWGDEIIVVDSGSTDGTIAVCREYTDRVYVHDWPGHVAQKNRAIDYAVNDWVFCIDADERVSDRLRGEIEREAAAESPYAGYTVPRLTRYLGRWIRHSSWYPDRKLRFFSRSAGRFTGKDDTDPHDRVEVQGPVKHLSGDLLHYSYQTLSHHVEQINRYTGTMALLKHKRGKGFPVVRMLVRPPAKFLKMYVLRLGFLDGKQGFVLAGMGAVYEFLKYAKLFEIRRNQS